MPPSYGDILPAIADLYGSNSFQPVRPAPVGFPFKEIYDGQLTAIDFILQYDESLLSSHTGSGKTPVFLFASRDHPTLVVEPRKFLQQQVGRYYNDFVIFGKRNYDCFYASTAATAPCMRKQRGIREDGKMGLTFRAYDAGIGDFITCDYPCPGCRYVKALNMAKKRLQQNGCVVANFGNFWKFLDDAKIVVLDEADAFFQSLISGKAMRYITEIHTSVEDSLTNEKTLCELEIRSLVNQKPSNPKEDAQICSRIHNLQNHLENIEFLKKNHEICFQYKKKSTVYVEISPAHIAILKDRLFPLQKTPTPISGSDLKRKLIIVTATPSVFNTKNVVSYSVFQRTGIFNTPIAKMTSKAVENNPDALGDCASFIKTIHEVFKHGYNGNKCVVHCGNLATHAAAMQQYLGADQCDLHTAGNLMEIVEGFRASSKEYLLVAGAEYGADFDYINHQFVLKVPYATLDERLRALKVQIGNLEFNRWYTMDALNRLVQQCGRVGRGAFSFGCTFILDSKFTELYYQNKKLLPEWFKNRLFMDMSEYGSGSDLAQFRG